MATKNNNQCVVDYEKEFHIHKISEILRDADPVYTAFLLQALEHRFLGQQPTDTDALDRILQLRE